jgi:hypothetical protein
MTDPTPQTTPTRDEAVRLLDEKALAAACEAVLAVPDHPGDSRKIRDAIAAYLASAPAPASGGVEAVVVKALEWESGDGIVHDALSWRATVKALALTYCVVECQWWLVGEHSAANLCGSDDEAKAAAQADYEQRIRLALSPAATSGLAMPSREWIREKIVSDPDVEDCGAVPAATPVSEAEPVVAFPEDATPEMVAAALKVDWSHEDEEGVVHNVWHAMCAAMPVPLSQPASSPAGGDVRELAELRAFKAAVYELAGKRPVIRHHTEPAWNVDLFEVERRAALSAGRVGE